MNKIRLWFVKLFLRIFSGLIRISDLLTPNQWLILLSISTIILIISIILSSSGCSSPNRFSENSSTPVVSANSQNTLPLPEPLPESLKSDYEFRKNQFQIWLTEANSIAQKTKDPEAMQVVEFIRKNAMICLPTIKYIACAENKLLRVVILTEEDQNISDQWKAWVNSKAMGIYTRGEKKLVLQNFVPLENRSKGLILLHEGRHAEIDFNRTKPETGSKTRDMEEVQVRSFIFRLHKIMGGQKYESLLEDEVKFQQNYYQQNSSVLVRVEHNPLMDQVFGPTELIEERKFRQEELSIAGIFTFFDRNYEPQKAEMMKVQIIGLMTKKLIN